MTTEQRLLAFKILMTRKLPFYGDVLLRLPIVPRSDIGTAATDGHTIWYSPKFFASLTDEQMHYVLMHEVLHVLLLHPTRRGNRDPKLWNIACDIVVNNTLDHVVCVAARQVNIPMSAPAGAIRAFIDQSNTVESLYGTLYKSQPKTKGNQVVLPKSFIPGDRWRQGEYTAPIPGDLLPSEEGKAIENAVGELLQRAVSDAERRGDSVSSLLPRELIGLTHSKKLDWRKLLREFLEEEASDDTAYTTPERKYLHMDLILPGHSTSRERLDEVWAFVDSSGSVDRDALCQFLTQLHRICKDFSCVVNIAYWDTSVTDVYRNLKNPDEILNAQPRHSGGTDINCVYTYLEENRLRPTVMIILTDGYFGILKETALTARLRRKTVLLLSNDLKREEFSRIGKVAWLN